MVEILKQERSSKVDIPLSKQIYNYLLEAEGPKSKTQIACFLGIDVSLSPGESERHRAVIAAIDHLLLSEKKIEVATYLKDPPDRPPYILIGPGTFGYYPAVKADEYEKAGILSKGFYPRAHEILAAWLEAKESSGKNRP